MYLYLFLKFNIKNFRESWRCNEASLQLETQVASIVGKSLQITCSASLTKNWVGLAPTFEIDMTKLFEYYSSTIRKGQTYKLKKI